MLHARPQWHVPYDWWHFNYCRWIFIRFPFICIRKFSRRLVFEVIDNSDRMWFCKRSIRVPGLFLPIVDCPFQLSGFHGFVWGQRWSNRLWSENRLEEHSSSVRWTYIFRTHFTLRPISILSNRTWFWRSRRGVTHRLKATPAINEILANDSLSLQMQTNRLVDYRIIKLDLFACSFCCRRRRRLLHHRLFVRLFSISSTFIPFHPSRKRQLKFRSLSTFTEHK